MADADGTPTGTRARIVAPAVFWLLVLASLVLFAGHFLVGLSAAVADGLVGAQARSSALASCAKSAVLPLVAVLGLLAAFARTRTREHLALAAFVTLAAGIAILWPRAAADLERVRSSAGARPAPQGGEVPTILDDLGAGCRDGCPADVSPEACERFCACFEDQMRRMDPAAARRLLSQPEDPAVQQQLERMAMQCPSPNDPPATAP